MLKKLVKEKIDSACSIVPCYIDPRIQRENSVREGCYYCKPIICAQRGTGNAFCVMNRTLSHHQKHLVVSLQDDNLPATFLHIGFTWERGEETATTTPGEGCKVCSVLLSNETQQFNTQQFSTDVEFVVLRLDNVRPLFSG